MSKSKKKLDCESYEAKYVIFATVIDMLAHKTVGMIMGEEKAYTMTFNEIREGLFKNELVSNLLEPYEDYQINQWISELSWLSIITRVSERKNNSVIQLTGEGLNAYKSQVFHSIAANLLEARESRRMSKVAIIIAIISCGLTTLFAIFGFVFNILTSSTCCS